MKTLYISDLDGTLLNSKGILTKQTKKEINELIKNGMTFSVATSRPMLWVKEIANSLGIKVPVIVYNGVFIIDTTNNKTIISNYFKKEENTFLKEIFEENNILPNVYSSIDGIERALVIPEPIKEYYLEYRKNDKRLKCVNSVEELYIGDIFSYLCIGTKEILEPIYNIIKSDERFYCVLQQELYNPKEYWLDISTKEATKANATLKLKELLKCDKVVAFGDGLNDMELFSIADECYAVENANIKLKEIATGVILANEENGVAEWLKDNVK